MNKCNYEWPLIPMLLLGTFSAGIIPMLVYGHAVYALLSWRYGEGEQARVMTIMFLVIGMACFWIYMLNRKDAHERD